MKLKDFVFNSLRARSKKKKAASPGTVAVADISPGCFGLDKNRNWFPTSHSRRKSQSDNHERDDLTDANWQGNALYKGLVISDDAKENCALLALDYSSGDHLQLSHSERILSTSLTGVDGTLDNSYSQDTVSENFGSFSSMCPLSEADTESFVLPQNYSYNYHHERRSHHEGHHLHSKKATTLHQQHNQSTDNVHQLVPKTSHNHQKLETGFFRKSLASLKNIRKDSSKTKLLSYKQTGHGQIECAAGLLPADATKNKGSVPKISTKLKQRGPKLFSKSKGNKDVTNSAENFENQWALERGTNNDFKSAEVAMDPFISPCMLYDKPYIRENSVESCPPRHYSFREELSMRDFDLTSFELTSFSGYESDISRSRGRKARSRIKTNPWLPSPQLSIANRWKDYHVHESNENIPLLEVDWGFSQPDPLEYHESCLRPFLAYPTTDSRGCNRKHSSRKSPTGIRMTSNLTTVSPYSVTKRDPEQQYSCFASWEISSTRTSSLNDLSNSTPTIKQATPFLPNAEFSLLAENIEQLATNISFEYDDIFDTTMESVSAGKETCPSFLQEMCTDEENNQIPQQEEGNRSRVYMSHSPDSGVGGLSYSDVDNNLTPTIQREATQVSVECSTTSPLLDTSYTIPKEVSDDNCKSGIKRESRTNSSRDTLKPEYCSNLNMGNVSGARRPKSQSVASQLTNRYEDYYLLEENCVSAINDDYVYEKKACLQGTQMTYSSDTSDGRTSFVTKTKTHTFMDSTASHIENTKLEDEDCRNTQKHKYNDTFFGTSEEVGTEILSCTDIIDVAYSVKPSQENTPAVDTFPIRRSPHKGLHAKPRIPLNNMEKSSSRKEQPLSWMDEFDFPRNITANESLESPTENWQWDYQFAMYHSLKALIDDCEGTKGNTLDKGSRSIEVEELMVSLEGTEGNINLQQETNRIAGTKDSLDTSTSGKLENAALGDGFEMNDACVQTDFEDGFNSFDDVKSLEDLEDGLFDFSECRDAWLPRENAVLNTWTGCETQARDSEIIADKCENIRSEEGKVQENIIFSEQSTPHCELCHLEWKTHSETHCHAAASEDLAVRSRSKLISDDVTKQLSSRLLTVEKQADLQSKQKPAVHPNTNSSEETENIPISSSQLHFRSIFNHAYISSDSQKNQECPQLHSSETIVKLSDSDCSPAEEVHRKYLRYERDGKSSMKHKGKPSKTRDNVQHSCGTSVSTPESNTLVNDIKSNKRVVRLERIAELGHIDANGNFLSNRSRLKRPCESLRRFPASEQNNFGDFLITPLNANKAAYLTCEADSPLCRSLVEDSSLCRALVARPFCRASDDNQLSRLRFQHLSSFRLNPSCTNAAPASVLSPGSSPLMISTWDTNSQDIRSCKKNNQTLIQDNENATIDLFTHGQSQQRSSTPQYSLQILNEQVDNAEHSKSAKEKSSERFEMFPNSVYSFARCFSKTQHQDSIQTSFPETESYSSAACETRNAISRFLSTPSGSQPRNDSKCLAEKVISLCQEKDLIFQKIKEAKQEEVYRKEHRLQIQRKIQAQTREALLQPLIELRNKLEEQSRRLNENCTVNGNPNNPFRFL